MSGWWYVLRYTCTVKVRLAGGTLAAEKGKLGKLRLALRALRELHWPIANSSLHHSLKFSTLSVCKFNNQHLKHLVGQLVRVGQFAAGYKIGSPSRSSP